MILYKITLSINDLDNKEIHKQILFINKNDNYLLNLDYIFSMSSRILNKKKIKYKYGLSFKLGYLF